MHSKLLHYFSTLFSGAALASIVKTSFAAFLEAAFKTCCRAAADLFFAEEVEEVAEVPVVSAEASEEVCASKLLLSPKKLL